MESPRKWLVWEFCGFILHRGANPVVVVNDVVNVPRFAGLSNHVPPSLPGPDQRHGGPGDAVVVGDLSDRLTGFPALPYVQDNVVRQRLVEQDAVAQGLPGLGRLGLTDQPVNLFLG
jgi:hypothetical protein